MWRYFWVSSRGDDKQHTVHLTNCALGTEWTGSFVVTYLVPFLFLAILAVSYLAR